MKITQITTHLAGIGSRNLLFVQVHTDEGLVGVGEAYSCGPDEATENVVQDFAEWLVGRDPQEVERLWQLMYNGSRFPGGSVVNSAISGIEQALWDIKGKALGVPVYQLLGGKCRDRVRVYQSPHGTTPEALAANAVALVEQYGYTALKIGPQPPDSHALPWGRVLRESAARLAAVRRAVGDDVDVGTDPHAKVFEPARALELIAALRPYRPYFVEEPLRPENVDALAKLRAQADVPIATGEMLYTKFQFRDLLVKEAADIIQPDVCCSGGILEQRKIAAMAEAFYVTIAPHNPMGPVATAVNAQLAACTPNFLILEYVPDDQAPRRDLVKEPLVVRDGYLDVPDKPGIGVELNLEAFAHYPPTPLAPRLPVPRGRLDGVHLSRYQVEVFDGSGDTPDPASGGFAPAGHSQGSVRPTSGAAAEPRRAGPPRRCGSGRPKGPQQVVDDGLRDASHRRRVSLADADDPLVSLDPHQRGLDSRRINVEMPARVAPQRALPVALRRRRRCVARPPRRSPSTRRCEGPRRRRSSRQPPVAGQAWQLGQM